MASSGSIWVSLGLKTDNFQKGIKKSKGGLKGFQKDTVSLKSSLMGLGAAMAATFAVGSVTSFARDSVEAYLEQERALRKLENALGFTSTALVAQAAALQRTTNFGDEATIQMQAQLATLGLTEKQIFKLTPLVQDLSAQTGKSLAKSAKEVTSALSTGSTTLAKYGVELSASNTDAENFQLTVDGLTTSVGGAAEKMSSDGLGSAEQLSNAWGDITESAGKLIVEGLEPLVPAITDTVQAFGLLVDDKNLSFFEKMVSVIDPVAGGLMGVNKEFELTVKSSKDLASLQENSLKAFKDLNKAFQEGKITAGGYKKQQEALKATTIELRDAFTNLSEEGGNFNKGVSAATKKAQKEFEKLLKKVESAEKKFEEVEDMDFSGFEIDKTAAEELANELSDLEFEVNVIPEMDVDPAMEKLKEKNEAMAQLGKGMGDIISGGIQDGVVAGFSTMGEVLGTALAGGDVAAIGQAFLQQIAGVIEGIGQQMIALGTAALLAKQSLKTLFANPGVAIAAGIGLVAVGAAMNSLLSDQSTGFAEGGMVTGSVFANVGEGRGTTKSNPEVISPLDKLQNMIGDSGGGMGGNVTFRIEGNTLVGILNRQGKNDRYSS